MDSPSHTKLEASEQTRVITVGSTMNSMTATVTPDRMPLPMVSPQQRKDEDLESVIDELRALLRQESSPGYTPGNSYLNSNQSQSDEVRPNDQVNESWRRKICEWSFEVVDHFGFDREVVSIALNYLDRHVANASESKPISRRGFQLVAVTALFLAIKVHGETDPVGGTRRKLKIGAFVELSRGLFSVETLENMEQEILTSLSWRVNPPTTVQGVATLLRLLPKWSAIDYDEPMEPVASNIFEMARYLTELSVCVSNFTFKFKSSVVAYSAILCAIDAGPRHSCPLPYDVRVEFLSRIAGATSLVPSRSDVQEARSMLIRLCPSMFDHAPQVAVASSLIRSVSLSSQDENIPMERGGKTSPVCVCDGPQQLPSTHRKRTRSNV